MLPSFTSNFNVLGVIGIFMPLFLKQGNVPSRESIQVYYQKKMRLAMSRESDLDRISEEGSMYGSQRVRRRRAAYRVDSQDSRDTLASRDSVSRSDTPAQSGPHSHHHSHKDWRTESKSAHSWLYIPIFQMEFMELWRYNHRNEPLNATQQW